MKVKFTILLLPLLLFILIPMITADTDNPKNSLISQNILGKIAFASKRDGHSAIYTINDDGTDLKKLTTSINNAIMPQWSSDGTKILYLSQNGAKHEIWIMNNDGSGQKRLADNCETTFPPAWSPDNHKILFMINRNYNHVICTVDADGSNLTDLTKNNTDSLSPSWSSDGSKILYLLKDKDGGDICLVNQDGTNQQQLTSEGFYSASTWSPDGKRIACVCPTTSFYTFFPRNKICVLDSNGNNKKDLTDGDDFRWSPDGSVITFTRCIRVEVRIWEDGIALTKKLYGFLMLNVQGNGHYQAPSSSLQLASYPAYDDTIRNLDGGNDHDQLLASMSAEHAYSSWAPDSSKIAYVIDGKLNIYNINKADSIKVDISQLRFPNGRRIVKKLFGLVNRVDQKNRADLV